MIWNEEKKNDNNVRTEINVLSRMMARISSLFLCAPVNVSYNSPTDT